MYIGEQVDPNQDVGQAVADGEKVRVNAFTGNSVLDTETVRTGEVQMIHKLLSPVSAKEIGTIRCIGLNYTDHAKDLKMEIPKVPTLFLKPASCLIGGDDSIIIPCHADDEIDFEAELAIVIAKTCTNLSSEQNWTTF